MLDLLTAAHITALFSAMVLCAAFAVLLPFVLLSRESRREFKAEAERNPAFIPLAAITWSLVIFALALVSYKCYGALVAFPIPSVC